MWGYFKKLFSGPGVEVDTAYLYQPDDVVASRIAGVEAVAGYVRRVQELFSSCYARCRKPHCLDIAVVVGPGGHSRCWLVPPPDADVVEASNFIDQFDRITPPAVSGPLAFAIRAKIAGGGSVRPREQPPMPDAWRQLAVKLGRSIKVPDDVAADLWPDVGPIVPVTHADLHEIPVGFVLQVLEPTGGRLVRPAEWFYGERHRGPTLDWIISKEDPAVGPYETGVRIQMFIGVKQGTGKSPRQFVAGILSDKRNSGRVVQEHPEIDLGPFHRVGLLVEEDRFQILYSLFWGKTMDMVVVSIAGTPKELWDRYGATFDRMRDFELIDTKRFSACG